MITGIEATLAMEISKTAIASLVKPAITTALSGLRSLTSSTIDHFSDRFTDYLTLQTQRHGCMSTIVFGHQKLLEDLYIPLTVLPNREKDKDHEKESLLINRFNPEFLPKNKRVLITDTAGMGKSTLSKFLFLQCIKSCYAIPIFVELRHLSASTDVISVIHRQLNPTSTSEEDPKISKRQIERLLKKSNVIFFFDGYDEIPLTQREAVTIDIKNLIDKLPDKTFVITSRPESGLLSFPSFKQYTIRPLKKEESYSLIRKYDQSGGRSEQLIAMLDRPEYRSVNQFLKNPLLTSLLYRSFEYKQSVPLKKHVFYRQVFDALFDWHDASKDGYNTREKKSGLDIDAFHRMLRVVGFVSVMKGQVEGDADTVLNWIRQAKDVCNGLSFPESNFLDDLIRAVPVFVKEGDYYRWSHKSLAEYFAAQYICTEGKGQQEKVIKAFIENRQVARFSNVLDQVYDIDNNAFREYCILPLSREFSKFISTSYLSLDASVTIEEIKLRRACTFDRTIVFLDTAEYKDEKEFKELLNKLIEPIIGVNLDFEAVNVLLISGAANRPRLVIDIAGPYSSILSILESKKDPLVIQRSKLEWPKVQSRSKTLTIKTTEVMTDNSQAFYNLAENFAKTTRLTASIAPIIDTERMVAFERNFNDSTRLSSLTDNLLKPFVAKGS